MTQEEMLQILKQELVPALGCTEPVAIAYAAAKARAVLGAIPDRAKILVSRNILKNAMGVGIPGTKMVGLEMAAALGIIGGNSDAILEVLDGVTPEQGRGVHGDNESAYIKDVQDAAKCYYELLKNQL